MSNLDQLNYQRIEKAIQFISYNFKTQPNLAQTAQHIGVSPHYFQRLFKEWAGVSPKKFIQYLSLNYAKDLLLKQQSVLDTALQTGLSSAGRLHDLFVTIEAMTPGEFKNGGDNLCIRYSFNSSPFGSILVASTTKGVCYLAFSENQAQSIAHLKERYPKAKIEEGIDEFQQHALSIFRLDWSNPKKIQLHLFATPFQIKVWECLLNTPYGRLTTYGELAKKTGNPKAYRAVGTAVGRNPVAFIIPCHRVIQSSGEIGGFMWGPERKSAMIGWEAAHLDEDE